MPIFEYQCSQCGVEFEKLVLKAGGKMETVCDRCGSKNVTEKISAFASPSGASAGSNGACAPSGG